MLAFIALFTKRVPLRVEWSDKFGFVKPLIVGNDTIPPKMQTNTDEEPHDILKSLLLRIMTETYIAHSERTVANFTSKT